MNSRIDNEDDGHIIFHYQSVWSPLNKVATTVISEMFPALHIQIEFLEPLMAFEGHITAQYGKVTDSEFRNFDWETNMTVVSTPKALPF